VSRRVLFGPEAAAELQEAASWYESERPGLGLAFLAAVERAVEHLAAWPEAGSTIPGVATDLGVRKVPVARFPYYLAFLVGSDSLRVLAVAHERRRPGYWSPRAQT
jgi:plasmid stabilization system protein ParE